MQKYLSSAGPTGIPLVRVVLLTIKDQCSARLLPDSKVIHAFLSQNHLQKVYSAYGKGSPNSFRRDETKCNTSKQPVS